MVPNNDVDSNTIAREVAQQIAQQVAQAVSDAVSKVLQSQTLTTGMSSQQDRMGDIGGTERLEKDSMDGSGLIFANMKRTYDEYQQESLESIKRNRAYVDKVISDAQQYDNQRQNIANQALQNAVETANMVGKQAVRHSDLAIDRQWNVDEQNYVAAEILRDETYKNAIAAAVAKAAQK